MATISPVSFHTKLHSNWITRRIESLAVAVLQLINMSSSNPYSSQLGIKTEIAKSNNFAVSHLDVVGRDEH